MSNSIKKSKRFYILLSLYLLLFVLACLVPPMQIYVSENLSSEQFKLGTIYTFIWNTGTHRGGYDQHTGKEVDLAPEDAKPVTVSHDVTDTRTISEILDDREAELILEAETYNVYTEEEIEEKQYDEALEYFENGTMPMYITNYESRQIEHGATLSEMMQRRIDNYIVAHTPESSVINVFYEYKLNLMILSI